jgi:hypothetical protein
MMNICTGNCFNVNLENSLRHFVCFNTTICHKAIRTYIFTNFNRSLNKDVEQSKPTIVVLLSDSDLLREIIFHFLNEEWAVDGLVGRVSVERIAAHTLHEQLRVDEVQILVQVCTATQAKT